MNYCTLFDSNYLDKGIVMIESLISKDNTAKVYVLCMDEKCKNVLDDWHINGLTTITLEEFEDQELLEVKPVRSKGEYCWSCTGKLIKYVITTYQCEICTYVDSDLFFFSDPSVLINEMLSNGCEVQAISHRFPETVSGRYQKEQNGRNCVQFNTFCNTEKSMRLLDTWIAQCMEECSVNTAGDQKYTDCWCEIDYVNISKNGGAGIAPWNLNRYRLIDKERNMVRDRYDKADYCIVFYHFQNITYVDRYVVRVMPKAQHWVIDDKLMDYLYITYLVEIEKVKKVLEEKYRILPQIDSYISGEKKKKNNTERLRSVFNTPVSITGMKICSIIRGRVRRKQTIIDLQPYINK